MLLLYNLAQVVVLPWTEGVVTFTVVGFVGVKPWTIHQPMLIHTGQKVMWTNAIRNPDLSWFHWALFIPDVLLPMLFPFELLQIAMHMQGATEKTFWRCAPLSVTEKGRFGDAVAANAIGRARSGFLPSLRNWMCSLFTIAAQPTHKRQHTIHLCTMLAPRVVALLLLLPASVFAHECPAFVLDSEDARDEVLGIDTNFFPQSIKDIIEDDPEETFTGNYDCHNVAGMYWIG